MYLILSKIETLLISKILLYITITIILRFYILI